MHGGRGGGELDHQSYPHGLHIDGNDLPGCHDSCRLGCFPDGFGPAQNFYSRDHSLCDCDASYDRAVRNTSFMAKYEIFKISEDRLDHWRYPDRIFGDCDHDAYSFLSRSTHEAGRTGLKDLKGSSGKNLLKRERFSRIIMPRNHLKDI